MSLFGGSAGGFGSWLQSPTFNTSNLTVQQFIGPGSPNPNRSPITRTLPVSGLRSGLHGSFPGSGKGRRPCAADIR